MARPDMVCHCLSLFYMIRNLLAWSDMVQPFVSHVLHVPTWSDIVRGGLTIQHTMEPIQRTIYAGSGKGKGLDNDMRELFDWTTGGGTDWTTGRQTDRTTRGGTDWTTGGELIGQRYGETDWTTKWGH